MNEYKRRREQNTPPDNARDRDLELSYDLLYGVYAPLVEKIIKKKE